MKCLKYKLFCIFFLFLFSSFALAEYNLLEDVRIFSIDKGSVVIFKFKDILPIYTLQLKKDGKGLIIEFNNTRIDSTDWIRKIQKTIIKSIDVGVEGSNIKMDFVTEEPIQYKEKKKKKELYLTLVVSKKNAVQKTPFKKKEGNVWYKNIKLPSLENQIEVPLTRGQYNGTPISVDFQNADIHAVLRLLAKIGGFNVVVSDSVKGTITLKLENVPWDQVLDMVLSTKGLGMIRMGNIVRVAPLDELYSQAQKIADILREQAREEEQGPLETVYLQVNYSKAENISKQIEKILSPRGEVTYEERTNQIILKDVHKVIKEAKELIRKLDQPTKQVLIEARIIEVQDSYEHKLGIRWSGAGWRLSQHTFTGITPSSDFSIKDGSGTNPGDIVIGIDPGAIVDLGVAGTSRLGFTFGHVSKDSVLLLDAQLSALESEGVARIISAPRVITEDHQEAEIKQGFRIPYLRQTQDGISTEFVDAALRLKVTPHVTPDNRINLELEIEKNAPDFGRQVNGVPSIVTRYAKTRVFVQNGETVVIGGIIERDFSRSNDKVPGLSDIPGAGELFKNRLRSFSKNELIVFITPRIVTSDVVDLF
ncbi:type IV pilus secretin PilQ [Thermosulfurimonas dismutans]|uniref:Type IV pilus biogenesis protein PilQ n=1 Tax=Thermosulfurimonas dismutans TaxID=999894 RepID=A0A179D6X5_9BACT|nr:type IV pilus secretin PilQ [Thermosulfurimonas dismutans]OAQ21358.1 Type IV pilus biogenesis protein PilQ [Thermosulfurimonas dismutans]